MTTEQNLWWRISVPALNNNILQVSNFSKECNDAAEFRESLYKYLNFDLVGPENEFFHIDQVLNINPLQLYSAGVLFPQLLNNATENLDEGDLSAVPVEREQEDIFTEQNLQEDLHEFEDELDAELNLANAYKPSAIGMSFLLKNTFDSFLIEARFAQYKSQKVIGEYKPHYKRIPHMFIGDKGFKVLNSDFGGTNQIRLPLADTGCEISITRREYTSQVCLISVVLINKRTGGNSASDFRDCFFQSSLNVMADTKRDLLDFSAVDTLSQLDDEELDLCLQYRNRKSYALGHGTSVDWNIDPNGLTNLATRSVPFQKVPPVVPRSSQGDEYSMKVLCGDQGHTDQEILQFLDRVPDDYEHWIDDQKKIIDTENLPSALKEIALQNINNCELALTRMKSGIQFLRNNIDARYSFKEMNKSIWMQQVFYQRKTRDVSDDWEDIDRQFNNLSPTQGRWRVFQLAFILMNIRSISDETAEDERETVDLIWFPTGGGKTEAYLGLTAFTILWNRLKTESPQGCNVFMRYTLRLLTVQQFQRAASLICALEYIAQNDNNLSSDKPITIGLWLGSDTTPNNRSAAKKIVNDLNNPAVQTENRFHILKCPCCGTKMIDNTNGAIGYVNTQSTMKYRCVDERCLFGKAQPLPICVVDEDLYEDPPTLMIATVDKFAMLAWNQKAGNLFSTQHSDACPDLIIQDELHLISGPVGTMVGLYEFAIDQLCTSSTGKRAKIIGSTATIRRAKQQIKNLYDREVQQFPPSGHLASDNYFAAEMPENDGRLYVGFMPTAASSFITGLIRLNSSLLEAAANIKVNTKSDNIIRDGYWTLLQYFNSLRELGRAATLLQQDIPEWMRSQSHSKNCEHRYLSANYDELTSRRTGEQITEIMSKLEICLGSSAKKPYDSVLATNMISVGLDIGRLGLMVVVGQPKTTSEYIQASSRVGRSSNAPGLVVCGYNPSKARDRSHYESFKQYHESMYRHVEPSSVTPFSIPAMEKALHAVLTILLRQKLGYTAPEQIDPKDSNVVDLNTRFYERVKNIDPEHIQEFKDLLKKFYVNIAKHKPKTWGHPMQYLHEDEPILAPPNWPVTDGFVAIPTPTSMRAVDADVTGALMPWDVEISDEDLFDFD